MADIKMINNYNIKDETARNEIENLRGEIPINVSELNNDAGYLTEHQDISHLALKSEIPSIEGLATKYELNNAIGDINTILDNLLGEAE